ncbi:MAG: MFS transporter [Dehalococcoidia bacterium]
MDYRWKVLVAVGFGTFMATMDFSIVNIALPTLGREFDRPPDVVVWATLTSSLVVTGLTLTAGRAGDLFGRKRIYVTGWVIFTLGMAIAPFAQTIEQLIAMRFFQAIGTALAIANGNAIVTAAFPPNERGRALGTTGAIVGAGLMSGPILGGVILDLFDWHAIFYLRVPIGLIAMSLALFIIRESEGEPAGQRRIDVPGAVLLFATLSTALLAVNRGTTWGWASPAILSLFAVSAVSLALFLRVESRTASPVVSLALFKVRSFSVSILSLMLNFMGQSAVTFLMPFYLTRVQDYGTARAGLVIATVPLMMLILSPVSGMVSDRKGFRHQTTVGLVLVSLGLFSLATLGANTPVWLIMARLAIIGVGTSVFMSPNSSAVMGAVPLSKLGTASASVATSRNIGNAVGLAISSAVLVGVASATAGVSGVRADQLPSGALLDGVQVGFVVAGCLSAIAVVASLALRPKAEGRPAASTVPPVAAVTRER